MHSRLVRAGGALNRALASRGACSPNSVAARPPPPFAAAPRPTTRWLCAQAQAQGAAEANVGPGQEKPPWEIKMLYDGDCPLCMKEVEMLMRRDEGVGKIDFVDISAPEYSAENNAGIDFETAMERIHAIRADGSVITNVEVFRELYEKVGLGWVYWITTIEPIGALADRVYDFWAKYRLPITGRPGLEIVLENRRRDGKTCADVDASCDVPEK